MKKLRILILKNIFKSIKVFKGIFEADGYYLNSSNYNETTFLIGYLFLQQLSHEYNQNLNVLKKTFKNLSFLYNKAIDGFKELSYEWEKTYKSLESHQSDEKWVNKFFIVEFPKFD